MKYEEIEGNLLQVFEDGRFDIIAHQSNCFCTMGSGIALAIKEKYPQAYRADYFTTLGDYNKLGNYSYAILDNGQTIINIYSQFNYGKDKTIVYTDYDALAMAFKKINYAYKKHRIGLPLIGCGSANGDWEVVKGLIQRYLKDMDVTIVKLAQK